MNAKRNLDVAIIGAGLGGISAAIHLAAKGLSVEVFEAQSTPGGKAAQVCLDGVWADTGPSVLTMPHTLDELLRIGGTSLDEAIKLIEPTPSFRYDYTDGCIIDVYPKLEDTLDEVEKKLGKKHKVEFETFLSYAKNIWNASAPHFLYGPAPTWASMIQLAFRHFSLITKVDPLRSMNKAIYTYISSPHLRMLLQRYATYNGSDPRVAPATLNCIAHVELALGGFGVQGGIHTIISTLVDCAQKLGVRFHFNTHVQKIILEKKIVKGIILNDGSTIRANNIVSNTDSAFLKHQLLPAQQHTIRIPQPFSMSGWTGIFRAKDNIERVAHTVVFPENYQQEFSDIFDKNIPPRDPTVYLCAQSTCHHRKGWSNAQPVFAMINTPPEPPNNPSSKYQWQDVQNKVESILIHRKWKNKEDRFLWTRTPTELALQYPGSRGAIYGASSNNRFAAFTRPPNSIPQISGLYLASGSAHPGGGMPLALLSGKAAGEALLRKVKP